MLTTGVADGIHLLTHAHVNVYLIEDDDGVTVVDAGLPSMWSMLGDALEQIGRTPQDVKALVLTHGHFDHVGFARRMHQEWSVPVLVHPEDKRLAAHPYSYTPQRNRLLYPLLHPRSLPVIGAMAAAGALNVRGIRQTEALRADEPADVPGRPQVIHTPGHTDGHVILDLPDRNAVISADALVTLDPYTGVHGPQIVASAATKDTGQAMASLKAIAATGAKSVLPGHGAPWNQGVGSAVHRALENGEH